MMKRCPSMTLTGGFRRTSRSTSRRRSHGSTKTSFRLLEQKNKRLRKHLNLRHQWLVKRRPRRWTNRQNWRKWTMRHQWCSLSMIQMWNLITTPSKPDWRSRRIIYHRIGCWTIGNRIWISTCDSAFTILNNINHFHWNQIKLNLKHYFAFKWSQ